MSDSLERPSGGTSSFSPSAPNKSDSDLDAYGDAGVFANGFDPHSSAFFPAPAVLGTGAGAQIGADLTESAHLVRTESSPAGAENLFDGGLVSIDDIWCCGDVATSNTVTLTFDSQIVITHFTIASSHAYPELDPLHWAIRGSNDRGRDLV